MSTYYFVPSRNVFGEGSVAETGHLMKSLGGTKAMIVTDEFLASNPMTTRIQAILKEAGVDSAVFGKAGVAFNNASLGYVHAMAHQLGGYYNLPHGVCNAILLPYVQEFNLIGNLERFAVIAKAMDLNVDGMSPFEAGEACVYGLKTFGRYLGIPQNLRSLGVDPADFEVMAENAMKDACAATNPRKATKDQIIAIFQKAYDGD